MITTSLRKLLIPLFVLLSLYIPAYSQSSKDWTALFNGKNLDGWEIKIAGCPLGDNYKNTFRAEDGMLRVAYDQYDAFDDHFGHLFFQKPFSYYLLSFQYRFTGSPAKGGPDWGIKSGGVLIHAQSAKSMTLHQDYPFSLEVQLLGGTGAGKRHTANACTNGVRVQMNGQLSVAHCVPSASKTYDGDEWVQVTVMVLGDSIIKHIVDSDTVITYEKPQIGAGMVNKELHVDSTALRYWTSMEGKSLDNGYIAIQAKSQPVDFKNIELLNLEGCTDRKAKNYKAYYVKADNKQCRY
jgi:hypothetical protein